MIIYDFNIKKVWIDKLCDAVNECNNLKSARGIVTSKCAENWP